MSNSTVVLSASSRLAAAERIQVPHSGVPTSDSSAQRKGDASEDCQRSAAGGWRKSPGIEQRFAWELLNAIAAHEVFPRKISARRRGRIGRRLSRDRGPVLGGRR